MSISSDKTPLYAFFVTAIALILGALAIWACSSVILRYQKLGRPLKPSRDKLFFTVPRKRTHEDNVLWEADDHRTRLWAAAVSLWTRKEPQKILETIGEQRVAATQEKKEQAKRKKAREAEKRNGSQSPATEIAQQAMEV